MEENTHAEKSGKEVKILPRKEISVIKPETMDQWIDFSKLVSESDLAPKDYKGKPGNVLIAMQMGAEVGISPMQSIQNIAVINGRPSIYGDMGKALLLSNGCRIEERDMKEIEASGEACCVITRPDGSVPITRTFSIEHAKKAGLWGKVGPWTNTPYRMLAWRAFWFAARDAGADYLRGLSGAEEVRDYDVETTVVKESILPKIDPPRRASESTQAKGPETVNTKTGEVTEPPEDNTDPEDDAPETQKDLDPKRARMQSKIDGATCSGCGEPIRKGTWIYKNAKGSWVHETTC